MRTPEQVAADDRLTAAIEARQRVYMQEPLSGVLTAYVVVAKRKWWDEDGQPIAEMSTIGKDREVSLDELLGMVEYAAARLRKVIASDIE